MEFFTQNQPFQFGESVYSNGGKYGPVRQEHLNLNLLLAGEVIVKADNQIYRFSENQAFLIYSESRLEILVPRNQHCHIMWCHTGTLHIEAEARDRLKMLPVQLPPSELIQLLFQQGIKVGHSNNINLTRLRNSLGIALCYEYINQARLEEEEQDLPTPVWRAKKYLETHFQQPCKLEDIALAAALNPRYLIQLFKKHLGLSPIKYLWQLRGEKAMYLLLQSGLKINEIGYRCGFQAPHHFSRYIKEHYQYTPTQIRANAWQRDPYKFDPDAPQRQENIAAALNHEQAMDK